MIISWTYLAEYNLYEVIHTDYAKPLIITEAMLMLLIKTKSTSPFQAK